MTSFVAQSWSFSAWLIAAILLGPAMAQADECKIRDLANEGANKLPAMADNFKCLEARLSQAESKIGELEGQLNIYGQASGLVVAFNRDPSRPCPDKWKLFAPASGRFVVGAGDNENKDANGTDLGDYTVGTTSGEKLHQLTELEMPKHNHRISTGYGKNWHDGLAGGDAESGIDWIYNNPDSAIKRDGGHGTLEHVLEETGGDQPHNTMPPFVALYYCIKE